MPHHMLFIQGAGEGAYAEDGLLVERLREGLGDGYAVAYPAMADDGDAPFAVWKMQIDEAVAGLDGPVILVGHSVGGSVAAKYLVEAPDQRRIAGVYLLATPYWGGDGWRYDGYEDLMLPGEPDQPLVLTTPVSLYHCRNDTVVPVEHLALYQQRLRSAVTHVLEDGGHQFETDLAPIVEDIRGLGMT